MRNEIKLAKIVKLPLNGYSDSSASNKEVYLRLGRSVLRSLAKELGLREYRVSVNKAGIAVSGDVTLIGIWDDNNGIYVSLSSPGMFKQNGTEIFLWRSARHMKDYTGGHNRNMSYEELASGGVEAAATQMKWQLGR
jgi:hypothetical protein